MKPKNPGFAAPRSSRRSVIKGAVAGVTGLAAVGGVVGAGVAFSHRDDVNNAHAASANAAVSPDSIQTILNIAITAEELAVTFYTNGIRNANRLDLSANGLLDFKAALIEEQIHVNFLAAQGAKPLTQTFSFPFGQQTFERLDKFIQVQQLLEAMFITAYILAAKEFAMLGRPDLVAIAGQIGTIEAEHRAIGRAIAGLRPANNHAFSPLLLNTVGDAPAALKKNGFLSPVRGNSFTFKAVSTNLNGMSMSNMRPSDKSSS